MKSVSAFILAAMFAPAAHAGSVFDHVNTSKFADGAKAFYAQAVKNHAQRKKIIAAAGEECGGRYEGTEVTAHQLAHEIEIERHPMEARTPTTS